MWEISNSTQLLGFAYSMGLGGLFCLAYDILRALRKTFLIGTLTVCLQDMVFSVISAFITFTFLLGVTDGEIRAFVIMGIIIGFLVIRSSISVFYLKLLRFVFSRFSKLYHLIFLNIYKGFDFLEQKALRICKKSGKNFKKLLKRVWVLLYTRN